MDAELPIPITTIAICDDTTDAADEQTPSRRAICTAGCGRPSRVCLCPFLPLSPLSTSTTVIILHHPHALTHNPLSTLPLLSRSLSNLHLLSGRRLLPSSTPLLPPPPHSPALFLFPSPSAIPLSTWADSVPPPSRTNPVLILVDGTWKHANEMVAASMPFLAPFATQVCLPVARDADGESMFESELVLKKEPFKGCVSTMEAVARALRVLEPEGKGAEVEAVLVGVLKAMVGFQMRYVKQVKPRVRTRTKKEVKEEEEQRIGDGQL